MKIPSTKIKKDVLKFKLYLQQKIKFLFLDLFLIHIEKNSIITSILKYILNIYENLIP